MKDKINKICTELNDGKIAVVQATEQLFDLYGVGNSTIIDELFYKFAETEPNLSREEFNEVLKLWLYRWEKDQQAKQIMNEL